MSGWVDYDRHARTRPRDDFWGQVRRTVRGQAVGQEQIDMIVGAVRRHLRLGAEDLVLDLACGNGALTARIDAGCRGAVGVDVSPFLVDVAGECFGTARRDFVEGDAAAFVEDEEEPERFTKAVCYGSLGYMDDETVGRMLRGLHRRFVRVERVLLGNLADPARARRFYAVGSCPDLEEARSDIGVWRSAARVSALAGPGWVASASMMPDAFFGSHYRFDLVLERRG